MFYASYDGRVPSLMLVLEPKPWQLSLLLSAGTSKGSALKHWSRIMIC